MWTIETYKEVYARYEASGLLVKDFCENERITRSRFFYWQKKLRKLIHLMPYGTKPVDARTQFIPVLVDDKTSGGTVPLTQVAGFNSYHSDQQFCHFF